MAIDNFEVVDDWVFPLRLPGPRDSLKSLIECTNFSKREIQIMYRSFKQVNQLFSYSHNSILY